VDEFTFWLLKKAAVRRKGHVVGGGHRLNFQRPSIWNKLSIGKKKKLCLHLLARFPLASGRKESIKSSSRGCHGWGPLKQLVQRRITESKGKGEKSHSRLTLWGVEGNSSLGYDFGEEEKRRKPPLRELESEPTLHSFPVENERKRAQQPRVFPSLEGG